MIGGLGNGAAGKVQIYNPAIDTWTTGYSTFPCRGKRNSEYQWENLFCRWNIGSTTTTQLAAYNPALDSWSSPLASMPEGVNHAAAGTDGSKLYVFGGRDEGNLVSNGFNYVQIYDPATDTWESSTDSSSPLALLPQARGGMGKAVFYQGEFYVIGGETSSGAGATTAGVYDHVDIYNPATNIWRMGLDMPTARHGIFPLLHSNQIYVAGGGVEKANSQSKVFEVYHPA